MLALAELRVSSSQALTMVIPFTDWKPEALTQMGGFVKKHKKYFCKFCNGKGFLTGELTAD